MADLLPRLERALASRYRIVRELGEGGMATVFLAEDLKHERQVALKVLKPELAAVVGAERFLAEIRTTANLQHPHILPLFDSGEADGLLFYVMPYVEGETLRDRIRREEQLPVDDAVAIARDVAAALDYAHRHGIIHRDIKPANILLHDGQPVVADFGIALAMSEAGGGRLTETGLSLGTPHYMSPEQATGDRAPDARSDIYSLGCVLYEMLVGEPPHTARTAQGVVAKILSETPAPVSRFRQLVPANVEAAVTQALSRAPADRFASAAAFGAALDDPSFRLPTTGVSPGEGGTWGRIGPVAAAVAAAALLLAGWGWLRQGPRPAVSQWSINLPGASAVMLAGAQLFDIAPDGTWLVYSAPADTLNPGVEGGLRIKYRDRLEPVELAGTSSAIFPRVSPDGERIVFFRAGAQPQATGTLEIVSPGGSPPVRIADGWVATTWLDDETVLYKESPAETTIHAIAVSGAEQPRVALELDSLVPLSMEGLPGGDGLVFSVLTDASLFEADLYSANLRTGRVQRIHDGAVAGWYLRSGHLLIQSTRGELLIAPFSLGTLELTGPPVPVQDGVLTSGVWPGLALSDEGTMLRVSGPSPRQSIGAEEIGGGFEMVWIDRAGQVSPVERGWRYDVATGGRSVRGFRLSPEGRNIAFSQATDSGLDVWVKQLPAGGTVRLTSDPGVEARPKWSPGGETVWYLSNPDSSTQELAFRRADGSGTVQMVDLGGLVPWEVELGPSGEWAVVRAGGSLGAAAGVPGQAGTSDLWAIQLAGGEPMPLLTSGFAELSPRISPDGRWLAYVSDLSGEYEVYVRPFPNVDDARELVSTGSAHDPLWSRDGSELFYIARDPDGAARVVAVAFSTTDGFSVESRETLFQLPVDIEAALGSRFAPNLDITPDGTRFLMERVYTIGRQNAESLEELVTEAPRSLVLVENWFTEVEERLRRGR